MVAENKWRLQESIINFARKVVQRLCGPFFARKLHAEEVSGVRGRQAWSVGVIATTPVPVSRERRVRVLTRRWPQLAPPRE